ncbi:MAG: hypothetical protein WCW36_01450 [Candidatus Paceibacterota bacterium]
MKNQDNSQRSTARRALPFFVEFVKFSAGFAVIIAAALITLHVASAAMN